MEKKTRLNIRRMATFLFTLLFINFAPAQHSPYKDQLEVQQTVIKLFDALSARDAKAVRSVCTADVRFNEYGEAWTIDTLIHKAITKNTDPDFKRTNKLDFLNTTIKGEVAWTTYNLHSSIVSQEKNIEVYWMETVVAVRDENKWKIKLLHSTKIDKK